MAATAPTRILLLGAEGDSLRECRPPLAEAGWDVAVESFGELRMDNLQACHLIVLEAGRQPVEALRWLRRFRTQSAECFVPLLFVADGDQPEARLAGLGAGSDACLLRPFLPEEFLAHCQALLRLKHEHDRMRDKAAEMASINRRLQTAYGQIDTELELAGRVQRNFLPAALPELGWARFAVCYRPCGRVGGDFYDVFRLDEHHVGLYVADVMGHGVPASLLTVYLKQAVRGKEIIGHNYRLLPPAEVLSRLNRDLIAQELADSRFITMVYGLLDGRDGTLHFACAGHPFPLLIPATAEPVLLRSEGSLLGVFDTEFEGQSCRLSPGDKVLFYTDGADDQETTSNRLLNFAVKQSRLPIDQFAEEVTRHVLPPSGNADDWTLLGLEMQAADDDLPQPLIRS